MKILITQTNETGNLDGVPCRLWEGEALLPDGRRIPCTVFVHRVAVRRGQDQEAFQREFEAVDRPRMEAKLRSTPPKEIIRP